MHNHKHLYSFIYDKNENDLCKLESRSIFEQEEKNKLLFSNIKVEPSSSAFIKRRLDIISSSEDYSELIDKIKKEEICIEGFKVEYFVLAGDTTEYTERLHKLKDIGYSIEGYPDYYHPILTYALCYYGGVWYFGILTNNNFVWLNHNDKPCSYSNSIGVHIAKALVNIAAKGDKECTLLDACCGVGTIMLEACFAGYNIEGCDINEKIYKHAKENIAHFNYSANVYHSDIKDISKEYDAAIIDLPYNLYSVATESQILHIIESTAKTTHRLVIVSTSDISNIISTAGLKIIETCNASKIGKANFIRKIWVCEKV